MLSPGTLIDRYELVCPVGEGGMGQVWIARHRGKHGFQKLFALKAIHPRFAGDPVFRRMFLDEAKIVSAIDHPNVAQVFDLGEAGTLLYLVMEYVDGESLSALIASAAARSGAAAAAVPVAVAVRIAADVCAGLDAAHRLLDENGRPRGVVHRDVSPHNVLVGVRGDVKLIDFGIAWLGDASREHTAPGMLKGKTSYMAPEHALGQPLGPYTDVFAAGATLYRMLAGRAPFDGGSDAATLALLLSGTAPKPLPDHVPPLVAAIVERAIAHDPSDRYESARAMKSALESALSAERIVPDVGAWASANLSEQARARREDLSKSATKLVEDPSIPSLPALAPPQEPSVSSLAPAKERVLDFGIAAPVRETTGTPGFMDVNALLAKASEGGAARYTGSSPPPADEADPRPADAKPFEPAAVGAKKPRERRPRWILASVLGVLLVAGGAFVVLLPGIVRDRVIRAARDAGVELTVGDVTLSFAGARLLDVTMRVPLVPSVHARATSIEAVGLTGREVRIAGLDAKLDGPVDDVGRALLEVARSSRRHIAGTPTDPRRYTIVSGRFTWTNAFGDGTRIEAGELHADVTTRGAGVEDVGVAVARFEVVTPTSVLGPWSLTFDRNPTSSRARLAFDPVVPDGPNALLLWNDLEASPALTVRVPRSPLANLGVRPKELGLPADATTEIDAKIEAREVAPRRVQVTADIALFAVRPTGARSPVDVKIESIAEGALERPLELSKTTVTVGPFVAKATGTVALHARGFRIDAAWRTLPIACERLVKNEVKTWGPLAEAIQDVAERTGAARVVGAAHAAGKLEYDTKTPGAFDVTFTTRDTCGLRLFGW